MGIFYVIFSVVAFTGCSELDTNDEAEAMCEQVSEYYFSPDNLTFIPPENSEAIKSMCHREIPSTIGGFFDLDFTKVCQSQNSIKKAIPLFETLCHKQPEFKELEDYHYQFLGLIINQEEHIYINAFIFPEVDSIGTFSNWKTNLIDTCGGGGKYWGLLINLQTDEIVRLHANNENNVGIFIPSSPLYASRCLGFENNQYFIPSNEDICNLESNFEKLRDMRAKTCHFVGSKIPWSYNYFYQYIGLTIDDQRYIFISANNLFRGQQIYQHYYEEYWRTFDGGTGSWGVLFNLDNLEFSDLQFDFVR